MRKWISVMLCISLVLTANVIPMRSEVYGCKTEVACEAPIVDPSDSNRLIVETMSLEEDYGAEEVVKSEGYYTLSYSSKEETESAMEKLQDTYGTNEVHMDQVIDVDDEIREDIELNAIMEFPNVYHGMSEMAAKIEAYSGNKNTVRIAILDTGLNMNSAFLAGRVNTELSRSFIVDGDSNVQEDYTDNNGHGSKVASVIRMCTPSNVEIVMYKVINGLGQTSTLAIKAALLQAIEDEVDVVTLSFGTTAADNLWDEEFEKLKDNGIATIVSAGNDYFVSTDVTYPAKLDTVITVTAIDQSGLLADVPAQEDLNKVPFGNYSSYGESVTFSATGSILCVVGNDDVVTVDMGTSYSGPIIASQLAYIMTFNNVESVDKYIEIMKGFVSSDFDEDYLRDSNYHSPKYGYGYLDFTGVDICECGDEYCYGIYHGESKLAEGIEFNGFQISTTAHGMRTIYSVESYINGVKVEESGLVYGLEEMADIYDMTIDSNSEFVRFFESTPNGKMESSVSKSSSASTYVMTMNQDIINTSSLGLEANYYIRAYAKLSNGTYVYSDIASYSLYDIADYLYQNNRMKRENDHRYLYDNILARVDETYQIKDFLDISTLAR